MASSALMTPTSFVRSIQIRLAVSRSSYSWIRSGNGLHPVLGQVAAQPAGLEGAGGQPVAQGRLEEVEDHLALTYRVHEHGLGPDVEGMGAQPHQVAGDARQLGDGGPGEAGPGGGLPAPELLDSLDVPQVVVRRRQVVGPVGEGDVLVVVAGLAQLLGAPVQVADDRLAVDDGLAVQVQDDAQHPVGRGVLGPHVELHLTGFEHARPGPPVLSRFRGRPAVSCRRGSVVSCAACPVAPAGVRLAGAYSAPSASDSSVFGFGFQRAPTTPGPAISRSCSVIS